MNIHDHPSSPLTLRLTCYLLSLGHHHHHHPAHGHEKSASSHGLSFGMMSSKSSGAVEATLVDQPQIAIPTDGSKQQLIPAIKPDGAKEGEAAKEEGGGDGGDGYPTQLAVRTVMMNRRSVEPLNTSYQHLLTYPVSLVCIIYNHLPSHNLSQPPSHLLIHLTPSHSLHPLSHPLTFSPSHTPLHLPPIDRFVGLGHHAADRVLDVAHKFVEGN